jgi:hypothetical protein
VEYGAAGVKDQPLSPAERQEAERLCQQATAAPWTAYRMTHEDRGDALTPEELGEYVKNSVLKSAAESGTTDFLFVGCEKPTGPADVCHVGNGPTSPANAQFIASSRTLLPRALATIALVEAARDDAEGRYAACYAELTKTQAQLIALTQERDALKDEKASALKSYAEVLGVWKSRAEAAEAALRAAQGREQELSQWLNRRSMDVDPEFAWAFDEVLQKLKEVR